MAGFIDEPFPQDNFHHLSITIESAFIGRTSSPNPGFYATLTIDDDNSVRTHVVKNTCQPTWNQTFDILVTPYSKLYFSVLDRNEIEKGTKIGEKRVEMYQLLSYYNGKIDNLELTIDLMFAEQTESNSKCGELICLLNGLYIDMNQNDSDEYEGIGISYSVLNGVRGKILAPEMQRVGAFNVSRQNTDRSASLTHNSTLSSNFSMEELSFELSALTITKRNTSQLTGAESSEGFLALDWEMGMDDVYKNKPTTWQRRPIAQTPADQKNSTFQLDDQLGQYPDVNNGSNAVPLVSESATGYVDANLPNLVDDDTENATFEDSKSNIKDIPEQFRNVFIWKINKFKHLCQRNIFQGHITLSVSRKKLFEESCDAIMRFDGCDLRKRLQIVFNEEDGLSCRAVSKQWFLHLSNEILNPSRHLFEHVSHNNYNLQISPGSYINPNHLLHFRFIGRFMAMALYHATFIYSRFTIPFYKKILDKKLVMKDIQSIDLEFYNSLIWIQNNNIDECDVEHNFSVDYKILGKLVHHELKKDGDKVRLTENNKTEFIALMTEWRLTRGNQQQMEAFLYGFNEVVPVTWLRDFEVIELELLLCGIEEINVDDWQKHTLYKIYSEKSKQIKWFWKFVRKSNNEGRVRLMQFVTGSSRVPAGGFGELMGAYGPQKFCIERFGERTSLPRVRSCFNRLHLPPYKNYEQLVEKLTYAIEESNEFSQG